MKVELSPEALEWQRRTREFVDTMLLPHEVEVELNDGAVRPELRCEQEAQAIEIGYSRMDVPRSHGGLELPVLDQVAVWEQLGRVTNALGWCFPEPQRWMFVACSDEQLERYVLPLMRGDRHDCYAITESGPGSDVAALEATASRQGNDYLLNGEKWYVTGANLADFVWFQAKEEPGGEAALFLVDADTDGMEMVSSPRFSHNYPVHHPTYRYTDVRVPAINRVGGAGEGMSYARSWFRRERLMIAARCCGAAARLIEEAAKFVKERRSGGKFLSERQAIQFMLADSATELWAARLMTFEAARAHDRGEPSRNLHIRCSMAKLYASEMANRVADRAVQMFGGRGYMRENVAERFFRELRVDRIWEGTSEIQRLIVARGLTRHGIDGI